MNANLQFTIDVKCPYCGTINEVRVQYDKSTSYPQPIYCDIEQGGCDRLFAIQIAVTLHHKIYTMTEVAK